MAEETKKIGFVAALSKFFGRRPGDTLQQFNEEIKALTYQDKLDLHAGLIQQGFDCLPPTPPTVAS